MGDNVVRLFSPSALSSIQRCGIDILNNLTPPDKEQYFTNNIDIFKNVVTQEYNTKSILQYEEMPASPQWLWFALCNRGGYFTTLTTLGALLNDSIRHKIKALYMLFYSDGIQLRAVQQCLEQIKIEDDDDTIGCDDTTKKMIRFFYMTIVSILEQRMSIFELDSYVNKTKLHLKYVKPMSETDTAINLAEGYVDETQSDILLFRTVLRLISVFQKYLSLSINAYIFAPGVMHFFFNFFNDKYTILEITDKITFLHQENTALRYFLKAASEVFNISDCSSHSWWDISIPNSYHYSIYSPLCFKVILAPIRHDLSDFSLVKLENIEHALERSRLRGELQLGFVDKHYEVVNIKKATVDQWKELCMYFMAPFMKIQGFPASQPSNGIDVWTQKQSMWIATAAALIFIGPWANMSQMIDESTLKLMPMDIKLFTDPIIKENKRSIKTYDVLLPILINNHQINISGVYGDCMISSQNGHWGHLTKQVLYFFILCKKYPSVKTWLLNVNSMNNKEFVKSLHPLMSTSYNNPAEIKLNILKKMITADDIIEHTAKLLRDIDRDAWTLVKIYIPDANLKPIYSEQVAVDNIADDEFT